MLIFIHVKLDKILGWNPYFWDAPSENPGSATALFVIIFLFLITTNLYRFWTFENKTQKLTQNNYRPQRSWAKVIFLHVSVILLTGGLSAPEGGCLQWGVSAPEGVGGWVGVSALGGVCSQGRCLKFSGGVWNFRGWGWGGGWWVWGLGGCLKFFFFFSQFLFPPKKFLLGCTPPDSQCAAGTHPTGMHSC